MQLIEAGKAMISDTVRRTVGFPIACLLALFPWQLTAAATAAGESLSLEVRPRVCVRLSGEEMCAMHLLIRWKAERERDVCLRFAGEETSLQCWQAQRQGVWEMSLERENNTTVQLLDPDSEAVLLESLIPVISRDLRDTRRRRRHVWSIL